jgi:hypothetical protein
MEILTSLNKEEAMKKLSCLLIALLASPAYAADPAPATPPAAAEPAATPAAPAPAGTVARSQFTSEIQALEPADNLSTLANDQTRIYFFSELRNLSGHKVTHRWEHNGKVMAEVPIRVGGDRWRAHSYKTLDPSLTGEWKVTVVDETGATLSASSFTYAPAAAAPAAPPAAAEPAPASAPGPK